MEAIEVFCGAGGTSFGAQSAGVDVRLGLDIDPSAVATFCLNHPGARGLAKPIEQTQGREILRKSQVNSLDLLIGGPSCQGYSTMGKRIDDDPRNTLYVHYLRIVKETRPKWIFFENVKGILLSNRGEFFRNFTSALDELGYKVTGLVVNAADYGVPQRRERVIVIGNRIGIQPSFPPQAYEDPRCRYCSRPDASNRIRNADLRPNCVRCGGTGREPSICLRKAPWISLKDAMSDLPWLENLGGTDDFVSYAGPCSSDYQRRMRNGSYGYTLHRAKRISTFAESVVSRLRPGEGIRSIPEDELPERFKVMRRIKSGNFRRDCTTLYHRLAWDMPSYTITCYFTNVSSGAFTHPEVSRSITVREAARLQSFPDRFRFAPGDIKRQVGNAVPPILAEAIIRHIDSLHKGETVQTLTEGKFVAGEEATEACSGKLLLGLTSPI